MLVSSSEMRAIEERAFAAGITAEGLMEDAGRQIAQAVRQFFHGPGRCLVFFGKGHNGGDALVAARHLASSGWQIELRPAFPDGQWSALTVQQHARVRTGERSLHDTYYVMDALSRPTCVVLDGLLGIGAGGPLRDPIKAECREINRLRADENAHVFAIDLPTGLNPDTGSADPDTVIADCTLTIGFPKAGLVADGALNYVGRLALLPLTKLAAERKEPPAVVATAAVLAPLLRRRAFDTHKGNCGRIGIVAGSPGFTGAAVLCADAAVRGGAGLVSLYVPPKIHGIVAAQVTPEVMVHAIKSPLEVLESRRDILAIGPGLGHEHAEAVLELIARAPHPTILDADALNILAHDLSCLARCAGPRLLTPHPGEMARLDPDSSARSRRETAEHFTERFPQTLLLKGARTLVAERGQPLSYNSTGHAGLATGGIGDILTGLLAALAGQGLSLYDAARTGSWLIGRAAELAIYGGRESAESLRATAVLEHLGGAFHEMRSGSY